MKPPSASSQPQMSLALHRHSPKHTSTIESRDLCEFLLPKATLRAYAHLVQSKLLIVEITLVSAICRERVQMKANNRRLTTATHRARGSLATSPL
jgi:hypothetical protein